MLIIFHSLLIKFLGYFTSSPMHILFDRVNGSTGMPALAAVTAAASDSICSRSLFFLFSSCDVKVNIQLKVVNNASIR